MSSSAACDAMQMQYFVHTACSLGKRRNVGPKTFLGPSLDVKG